ncbi:hypothetical protein [Flavobacterium psychrotrophum]|uniref:hypothetical protein n=1 Tax=Flavobacterium psychrotrophum TaxID=2294119 RepID=UPI000E31228F|nr:hypothetical protein [Flavobacterium psychrotrophum]
MKINFSNIIIAGLTLALLFSVRQCRKKILRESKNLSTLTDTVAHFTNVLGTQTAAIKTLQLDKSLLNDLIFKKDSQLAALTKSYAKVYHVIKYKTFTRYDTLNVVYHDSVPCIFRRNGMVKKPWYRFRYTADQKGITLDSLSFPNTTTIITGTKRKWFLGKETVFTEVTNTNPHIKVTALMAAEVNLPVPIYKKWYVWLGIGLAGGFLLVR